MLDLAPIQEAKQDHSVNDGSRPRDESFAMGAGLVWPTASIEIDLRHFLRRHASLVQHQHTRPNA